MATGGTSFDSKAPVKLKKKRPKVGKDPKKKNPLRKKPKAKTQAAPKPYDPLAPLDPSVIETNARARAMSQVKPELDSLGTIARDTAGAHTTRQKELVGWYGGLQNTQNQAFTDTSNALNRMIALNNQGGVDANNVLTAALRQGDQTVGNAAAMMPGVTAPQDADAQIMASAAANAANQSNFTAANAMGEVQAQGDRRQLATVGGIEASAAEARRYGAERKELGNQVIDVARRIPDLTNVARQDIQQFEASKTQLGEQKANRLFQQWLAEKELGLKTRNQSFQEYVADQELGLKRGDQSLEAAKFKHQTQIDWAQIGLNQREIEARLSEIHGGKKDDRSKLRAKQWDNGLSMLGEYMKPGDNEGPIGVEDPQQLVDDNGNPLQPYRRKFEDALRILTGRARMSRKDALTVLASSDFASWRSRARKMLKPESSLVKKSRGRVSISKKPPVRLKK